MWRLVDIEWNVLLKLRVVFDEYRVYDILMLVFNYEYFLGCFEW